jgi:hypothetical protein
MRRRWIIAVVAVVATTLSGCAGTPQNNLAAPSLAQGVLYVSDASARAIFRFDNAFTATGNVAPAATISGADTQIVNPQQLLIDEQANRLFVVDFSGSVLIFENASTKNGNVAPDRMISGAATLLTVPEAVALDKARDLLYVSAGSRVVVFSATNTNGNVAPSRVLTIPGAGFISDVVLDQSADCLFVLDDATARINIFDSASQQNGTVAPSRFVAGSGTGMSEPFGLGLHAPDRLLVSDLGGSGVPAGILSYVGPGSVNGNVLPSTTISGGNTGLNFPRQIALSANADLYVANSNAGNVVIFSNALQSFGDQLPARKIAGGNTGLVSPVGIALDATR